MFKKLFISLSFLLVLFFPPSALAQSEFSTHYTVDYTVSPSGLTHTKFDISLTNNLSNIYASEFSLSIGSTQLQNIHVYNDAGDLEPTIATGNKTTNITIPFKDKVLGKDKAQIFILEFDTPDFANRSGSIWEISIPRLSKTDSLSSYQLSLSIPQAFGPPTTISPQPVSQTPTSGSTIYRFAQADLFTSGIAATFGQIQYFDYSLTYHLNNPQVYKVKTEIALPPDTAFQKVILQTLDPAPEDVVLDPDGNWLASYTLSSKQTLDILATGSAQINLYPRQDFIRYELPDPDTYLSAQKFWEVNNPRIADLAQQLQTPLAIYQYIVDNLIYDYGRLSNATTRFGAANALDNQDSAICMEFTDLFIALARAAGIPARAVNGFAYTTNSQLRPLSLKQDVLHAWPEYYDTDKALWIPIDPTWGNTTGGVDFFHQPDLNHFTFAILGQDSSYPIPAGAYKLESNHTKDVTVEFGQTASPQPQTHLSVNLPDQALAGVPLTGQIILTNTGNVALENQTVTLNSQHFDLEQTQWTIPQLPPFATHTINLELPPTGWTQTLTDTLTITSDFDQLDYQLTLLPAYQFAFNHPKLKFLLLIPIPLIASIFIFKRFKRKK